MSATTITKEHYQLLFSLFQVSALVDTLDDMETSSLFVRDLKQKTNNFKSFLHKTALKELDRSYKIDAEEFEVMDRCITENAKTFGMMSFEDFFKVED